MLKKNAFQWRESHKEAFIKIKQALTQAPVLALPDYSQPFILETNASGNGLGVVLMQNGRPIAYLSKTIGPKAADLSTYDKEAMAILEALKKWKQYFSGAILIIRTYQQSLKYIGEKILIEGVQHKLLIKLLGYNYKIEYKKGRENKVADALSRVYANEQAMAITTSIPLWINDVIKSYEGDEKCQELESQPSIDAQAHPYYSLLKGIIRYKGRLYIGSNTVVRRQLITSFHDSPLGGHSGERATYQT